jgi:dipeptidyl-peptidase-4
MTESFPRQQARTRHFTLGLPRSFQISPDGDRVAFLRSRRGDDPVNCLWVLDTATGAERLVADPATLAGGTDLTEQEKAHRERVREQATGIVSFAGDSALTLAAFVLAGQVHVASLTAGGAAPQTISARPGAFDPRPDPTGQRVAYACDGGVRVVTLEEGEDSLLIGPDGTDGITFGLAEFVAAEEMARTRGFWWAPDGTALLVARVDETQVQRWHIADPANPGRTPGEVAYPAAGTANADVSLLLVGLDGGTVPVEWDRAAFPYLVTVSWDGTDPLIVVQTRDQRRMRLLSADPARGTAAVLREDIDEHWLDIVPGVPAQTGDGRIVWTADADGAKRLLVAAPAQLAEAAPVTPPELQVRAVAGIDGDAVLFTASGADPTAVELWLHDADGLVRLSADGGVSTGHRAGGTTVLLSRSLDAPSLRATVCTDDRRGKETTVTSFAEQPSLPTPRPDLFTAGGREIRTALVLPSWHQPGSGKLPVLLDPYGGPGMQRVVAAQSAFASPQWFAEQGFAVIVADGRGTPGRGPGWERAVTRDLAGPVLEDQVAALAAAADRCADLDTGRVAIRGWSFGGYLAALAVLRRPDVFRAAVAGAPVTDWRLYDTHYTERYLGHPADQPDAYDACSLLLDAHRLRRPLLLIHGLADDNVVAAHTLRLSAALLAAGRPHSVLPLSGVTHMTPQEEVAENLLLLQADFLRKALGVTTGVASLTGLETGS